MSAGPVSPGVYSIVVLAVLCHPGRLAACGGGPGRGPPPRSRVAFPSLASESEPSSSMPGSPAERIDSEGVAPSLVGALEEKQKSRRSHSRSIKSCPGGTSGPC